MPHHAVNFEQTPRYLNFSFEPSITHKTEYRAKSSPHMSETKLQKNTDQTLNKYIYWSTNKFIIGLGKYYVTTQQTCQKKRLI